MSDEAALIAGWLEDEWGLEEPPDVFFGSGRREADGAGTPLIKVYKMNAPSDTNRGRGVGYHTRRVSHRLTIDLRCSDYDVTLEAMDEINRILGQHAVDPATGYNMLEWDDGTWHAGYVGFNWITYEVNMVQFRKLTGV
jgi:hypothetical protein